MNYRSIPRISNSDLSEFRNVLFNRKFRKPEKASVFGTVLHEMILEPKKRPTICAGVDMALIEKLASVAREDKFLKWALQFSRKETVQLWNDVETGLELKSKLDIVHRDRVIADIKSTSCRSEADFIATCSRFDYDRQAAFYLDSLGEEGILKRKFIFVAIQKVKPFAIWKFEYDGNSDFIRQGRRKYQALLGEWKRQEVLGLAFVPSSWVPDLCPNAGRGNGLMAA